MRRAFQLALPERRGARRTRRGDPAARRVARPRHGRRGLPLVPARSRRSRRSHACCGPAARSSSRATSGAPTRRRGCSRSSPRERAGRRRAPAGPRLAPRARALRALRRLLRGREAARAGADARRLRRSGALDVARQRAARASSGSPTWRACASCVDELAPGAARRPDPHARRRRTQAGVAVSSTDPLAPLRRDVDLLASTLGATIAEQEGPALLEAVERIRLLARAAREHSGAAARTALLEAVARARRARAGARRARVLVLLPARQPRRAAPPHPPAAARGRERASGATRSGTRSPRSAPRASRRRSCAQRAAEVRLEPVLTAHPTEAARRTYLQSQLRLGRLLEWLDDPRAAPDERRAAERAVAEETTVLWQTDEVRSIRPSVDDEIRQGLWFFEASLLDVSADLARAARRGAARAAARCRCSSARGSAATRTATRTRPPTRSATRSRAPARSRCAATATRCASWRGRSASRTRSCRSTTRCAPRSRATSRSCRGCRPRPPCATSTSPTGAS